MKTKAIFFFSLLFSLAAVAQTVNVHLKNGQVVKYEESQFDYIDFTSGDSDGSVTYTSCPDANHPHIIDLGLPSGTKWACCNVGASSPGRYGDYYAWGETTTKSNYSWSTYKYCKGSKDSMTKYCTKSSYGTVDNKTVLDASDDVAHVKWGGNWCMPTFEDLIELRDKCTWTWTTKEGNEGYRVKGSNGGEVFLPAAGYRYYSSLGDAGSLGGYWTRTLIESSPDLAVGLDFNLGYIGKACNGCRYFGLSVRPVWPSE